MRKLSFPPVLLAISTKGCALVTPVAPLGSASNLVKRVMQCKIIFETSLFDGILLDTGVETVFRVRVARVLRKVQLIHLSGFYIIDVDSF